MYLSQINNTGEFSKTTDKFKISIVYQYVTRLYNAALHSEISFEEYHKMISDFNKNNKSNIKVALDSQVVTIQINGKTESYSNQVLNDTH